MSQKAAIKAVISGSFRRHMNHIQETVEHLTNLGVSVLSPADPRVVDEFGEFLFVASDRLRSIRAVQSRHLAAIDAADFVWLVDPDGYVGQSASMEIGFAVSSGTPVFTEHAPNDLTLRQYVETVPSLWEAIRRSTRPKRRKQSMLVEPKETAQQLHLAIDQLERTITAPVGKTSEADLLRAFADAQELIHLH